LFNTERAWSYAMELKRESRSSGDVRKKHHLIKRLKNAAKYGEQLEELCSRKSNKVDTRTVFDAQVSMVNFVCLICSTSCYILNLDFIII